MVAVQSYCKNMPVAIKRVYEEASAADGQRLLVDRLWPRGLTKERAAIDAWLRDLAPSDGLRKWYHAQPQSRSTFRKRYLKELSKPEAAAALNQLYRLTNSEKQITLLFASKDVNFNNAVVLKDLLDGMRKPPTGTGRRGSQASRQSQAKRMPRPK